MSKQKATLPAKYVKRRRQKKITLITLGTSFVCIATLVVISFLGYNYGDYTIGIKQSNFSLSLDTDHAFSTPTTLLRASGISEAFSWAADSIPDNEKIDSLEGGNHNGVRTVIDTQEEKLYDTYFAYTFFVKNSGQEKVNYESTIQLVSNVSFESDKNTFFDYLRVRVYENKIVDGKELTHNAKTYARSTKTPFTNPLTGEVESRECISKSNSNVCVGINPRNADRAEEFLTDNNYIIKNTFNDLAVNEVVRYTVVMWLEGNDPDCVGEPPATSQMQLAMTLTTIF